MIVKKKSLGFKGVKSFCQMVRSILCIFTCLKMTKKMAFYFSIRNERVSSYLGTVFENHRKSLIQHCERSELRLHFEWTKVN